MFWATKKDKKSNIPEPPITAADCNIKNQVELLIKWRVHISTLEPWVIEKRTIFYATFELTKVPHILSAEVNIEDLL